MKYSSPPPKYSFDHSKFQSNNTLSLIPTTYLNQSEKKWNYYGNNTPFLVATLEDDVWLITDGTGYDWEREGDREKIKKEMSCILYSELYVRKAGESFDYDKKHKITSDCRKELKLI